MYKKFGLVFMFVGALLFSGCLDGLQAIFKNPDGSTTVIVRYTVSKALFAMSQDSSPDQVDLSDLDEELLDQDELRSVMPSNIGIESSVINTDTDYGVRFELTVPAGERVPAGTPLIPIINGNKGELTLMSANQGEEEEAADPQAEMMAEAFFSSAKYKIVLDKSVFPKLEQVYLDNDEGSVSLEFEDIGSSYLIDLSMMVLMEDNPGTLIFLAYK